MRIKKYTAKSMREALMQIKEELGDNATILSSAKVKKMFGPDEYEVTAAIDEDASAQRPAEFAPLHVSGAGMSDTGQYKSSRQTSAVGADRVVREALPEPLPPNVRPYFAPKTSTYSKLERDAAMRVREIQDRGVDKGRGGRDVFASDTGSYNRGSVAAKAALGKHDPDEIAGIKADILELKDLVKTVLINAVTSGRTDADDAGWDAFVKRLTDSEVKPDIAKKLVGSIRGGGRMEDAELEKKLTEALSEQFPVSGPLKLKKGAPLIVAFVGPTGSGKTTTLAKLAAHCCFNKSKKISIITADTYRIAAIEQIRVFADIVNVGLQVVFSPDEIPDALAACDGSDVVFVDTAGRSQRHKEHMEELRQLVDVLRPDETHLVLSATTKDSDLADMVERYRDARINRLLFTKLDETTKLGNIFNVVSELRIPVSYFTAGQSVPDDIELAQAGKFVKKLMEGRAL